MQNDKSTKFKNQRSKIKMTNQNAKILISKGDLNPKFEARNPKQYRNSKFKYQKTVKEGIPSRLVRGGRKEGLRNDKGG